MPNSTSLPKCVANRIFWIWGVCGWVFLVVPMSYALIGAAVATFLHLGVLEELEEHREQQLKLERQREHQRQRLGKR